MAIFVQKQLLLVLVEVLLLSFVVSLLIHDHYEYTDFCSSVV